MNEKVKEIIEAYKTNKDFIIQKTAIVAGIVVGGLIAVAIVANESDEEENLLENEDLEEENESMESQE